MHRTNFYYPFYAVVEQEWIYKDAFRRCLPEAGSHFYIVFRNFGKKDVLFFFGRLSYQALPNMKVIGIFLPMRIGITASQHQPILLSHVNGAYLGPEIRRKHTNHLLCKLFSDLISSKYIVQL